MNNKDKKQEQRRFVILLLVSFLIHLGLLVWWMLQPVSSPQKSLSSTVTIQLKQQPKLEKEDKSEKPKKEDAKKDEAKKEEAEEAPKPKEKQEQKPPKDPSKDQTPEPVEESHAPTHSGEEFATRNQTDKSITEFVDGGGPKKSDDIKLADSQKTIEQSDERKTKDAVKEQKQELAKQADTKRESDNKDTSKIIETQSDSHFIDQDKGATTIQESTQKGLMTERTLEQQLADMDQLLGEYDLEGEALEVEALLESQLTDSIGNIELLSENALRDVYLADPFSEKVSNEIRMANKYLKRMNKQVKDIWVNPYKGRKMMKGVIIFRIDPLGYLLEARIYIPSGNAELDNSILNAIRQVGRYDVPKDQNVVLKYYSNLKYIYSSIEEKAELMPFELESKD